MPLERRDGYRLWVGGPVPSGVPTRITLGSLVIVRNGSERSPYLLRTRRSTCGSGAATA